ncbi:MAG TPA: hypothetical protein VJ889_20320, partial [Pseudomonas sp.]|nr:hypothetical protein [Pseudomonas sp.]
MTRRKLSRKGKPKGSLLRPEIKFKLSRNQNSVQFIFNRRAKAYARAFEPSRKHPVRRQKQPAAGDGLHNEG